MNWRIFKDSCRTDPQSAYFAMRKVVVFSLLFCFGGMIETFSPSLSAQSPTARLVHLQHEISPRLQRKFRRDAARLVLRTESLKEDLRYHSILIPSQRSDLFFSILSSLYLNEETARSIARCNVHTFPNPSIDHFVLIYDRNAVWADLLRDGITETTHPRMLELMDDYDLVIDKHVRWNDQQDAITIRSTELLNMAALANEFYNIEGVDNIDFGLPKVSGNDIQIRRIEGGWEVEYILRFGSYINGEGSSHHWVFQYLDSGKTQFVNESGDAVPEWMRCRQADQSPGVNRL